ncbi:MAG: 3-phosphoshikimate 1-carboxyvinyltransferase [Chloroflexi bacterium]|nr:3-phosphoshikimate 1-carboxyvinyltransferase [Chloroflexota bacterium]
MRQQVVAPARLSGVVRPPGDKSISHRAAMLNALATGQARVTNYSAGGDCASTLRCLRALGVQVQAGGGDGSLVIEGVGLHGLREPSDVLDVGNSGTTARLLAGLLAGQPFLSVLTGDRSLRSRPMDRIVRPLREMGAQVLGREGDSRAPLVIRGGNLRGIEYRMPVASAQVKSCLLIAGLYARGATTLRQPAPSRDHTERMLRRMGVPLREDGLALTAEPVEALMPLDVRVPADISSAAYWLVAGACHPDGRLTVADVGINPTRAGILEALQAMGARATIAHRREEGGEEVADVTVETSRLQGAEIGGELVPRLIDEVPVLALAACFARGTTVIRGAAELRVKESDRIRTTVRELSRLGAHIRELPDGMEVHGTGKLVGAAVQSHGDHRLAMMLGIAGLLAQGETEVRGAEAASVSYPGFWRDLERVAQGARRAEAAVPSRVE